MSIEILELSIPSIWDHGFSKLHSAAQTMLKVRGCLLQCIRDKPFSQEILHGSGSFLSTLFAPAGHQPGF